MVIILKDSVTNKQYKIQPASDGMQYTIHVKEYRKRKWKQTKYYPHDIDHAIRMTLKMILLDSTDLDGEYVYKIDPKDSASIKRALTNIRKAIESRCDMIARVK